MTIGIIIFFVLFFMGQAISQGNLNAALTVGGYFLAFVSITILLIFGCMIAYAFLIKNLLCL